MKLGSLFDGIGGWQLAAVHAGAKPVWSSEIEKFPMAVTKERFPDTVQLGDITKLDGAELEPVDIICAGSPCQDLSVAGKREGLKGERSRLFNKSIDIVRRMRAATGGRLPRYFLWENVPGAFSSNKGMDFRAVLEEITETEIPMPENNKWAEAGVVEWDGGSLAWRILDAQYWGVPQRRRRIFLVADFAGGSAGEILFEPESLPWHFEKGRSKGERAAEGTEDCIGRTSGNAVIRMRSGKEGGGKGALVSYDKPLSLATSNNQTLITCYNVSQPSNNFEPYTEGGGKSPTLISRMGTGGNQVPIVHKTHKEAYCIGNGQTNQGISDKAGTLNCMHDQQAIVSNKTVRRLTPTECERLQGLPDGYTLIDDKTCSDSARYKALGNGMAQPCADYVIRRIVEVSDGGVRGWP